MEEEVFEHVTGNVCSNFEQLAQLGSLSKQLRAGFDEFGELATDRER